jgi:hypothetical protein
MDGTMDNSFRFKKAELGVFSDNAKVPVNKLEKNGRVLGLTDGNFSLIDMIHSILKKVGKADVIVCTWSAGIKDAHQIRWMLDTNLIQSFTIVTDHSYVTRQKKYALSLEQIFGKQNIRTSEVHAKFVLIKNNEWSICLRTSMNLNANKTTESFELEDDAEVYEFYYNYIKHLFDKQGEGFEPRSWVVNKTNREFFTKNAEKSEFEYFTNE